MKFTITKKDFTSLVSAAAPAAAKKASNSALNSVMIVASESGDLSLTGTDLFTGICAKGTADVKDYGSALVPASELTSATKALPDGIVTVSIDGNRLQMQVAKSKQRIPWTSIGDYPSLPQMDPSKAVGVSSATMLLCLGSVAHSVMTDETRANMCGVQLDIGGGRCRGTATNGATFARRDVECSVDGVSVLVPNKSVGAIRQVLERAKGDTVGVSVHDGYIFVEHDNVALSAKLSGEAFPSATCDAVLGMCKSTTRVTASREMLLDAIGRVRAQDGGMPIAFTIGDGAIGLAANCDTGDASDSVDADCSGKPLRIGMNAQHIVATLAAMTSDDVTLEFGCPLTAVKVVHATNDECAMIIMPARL